MAALKKADPANLGLGRAEARKSVRDVHHYVALTLAARYGTEAPV